MHAVTSRAMRAGSHNRPAASAIGTLLVARAGPSTPWQTICRPRYSSTTSRMALNAARGTLREGSRTSPPGISAVSTPEYANTTITIAAPSAVHEGTSAKAKLTCEVSTKARPSTTSRNNGTSFNVASVITARAPSFTPKALSA